MQSPSTIRTAQRSRRHNGRWEGASQAHVTPFHNPVPDEMHERVQTCDGYIFVGLEIQSPIETWPWPPTLYPTTREIMIEVVLASLPDIEIIVAVELVIEQARGQYKFTVEGLWQRK